MDTFYDTLGVSKEANNDEIESVFRELVKKHHPDTSDSPNSQAEFIRLKTAREVLRDDDERILYDNVGHETYIENCLSGKKWPDLPTPSSESPSNPPPKSADEFPNSQSVETQTAEHQGRNQSTIGDYYGEETGQDEHQADGTKTETSTGHSEWANESVEAEAATNGGASASAAADVAQPEGSTQEDPDQFWESEAATVGGDEMADPEPAAEKDDEWAQDPQAVEQATPNQNENQKSNPRKYFRKTTILTIYAFLNLSAMFSGWSFYAARARQATLSGALQSQIVWAIAGTVFVLSIVHYSLRSI